MARYWDYPLVTSLREKVRARTPGTIPPMREDHPVIGLWHDITRWARRKIFQRT